MSQRKTARRWRAVVRQHDMIVAQNTRRAQGLRPTWANAPVSEFLRAGETFCAGNHTTDEKCDGEE